MAKTEAFINPVMLVWARTRARFTQDDLADYMRVKSEHVVDWESGKKRPTMNQAEKMAKKLGVSLFEFYLDTPPQNRDDTPIPDLRTIQNEKSAEISLNFRKLLDEVSFQQNWFSEYIQETGGQPLEFVGKFATTSDPIAVALDIRTTLKIDLRDRANSKSWEEWLAQMVAQIENHGIIVMRNSSVGFNTQASLDVEEFRGFVICDKYAPLIFINASDTKAAMIFTLAHELAHIWVNESSINNPDNASPAAVSTPDVEVFCNKVAAELLVPEQEFKNIWRSHLDLDANIQALSKHFRVSNLVILRRALDSAFISNETYSARHVVMVNFWKEAKARDKDALKENDSASGPPMKNRVSYNYGRLFSNTVLQAVKRGALMYRDAAQVLNLKIGTLDKLLANGVTK